MNTVFNVIIVLQVISALAIIGLVLVQHGKGADMGAAFGSGASGSLFGATGSSNFLSRLTAIAAAIFFIATLGLSLMVSHRTTNVDAGVMENLPAATQNKAPAQAVTPPATVPSTPAPPAGSGQSGQIPK